MSEYKRNDIEEYEEWQKQQQEREQADVRRELAIRVLMERPRGKDEVFTKDDARAKLADVSDEVLSDWFNSISERDQRILLSRFGLDGGYAMTYEALGEEFSLSPGRIHEIVKGRPGRLLIDKITPKGYSMVDDKSSIYHLNISTRAFNALTRAGIRTKDELCELTDEQILKIRNIGKATLGEIRKIIAELKEEKANRSEEAHDELEEATLSQEQAHELAVALLPEVREYIAEHRAEFEEWRKQKGLTS